MPKGVESERTTTAIGRRGEDLACDHLCALGYDIVERNYRCQGGEIDIVAREGDVLCFVEVRSLSNPEHGDPLETIDRRKMSRLAKAAMDFLEHWHGPWPPTRFDAVGVILSTPPRIDLVREAFEV